jgi:hypothetical protein
MKTYEVDGGEWSASRPEPFTPGKIVSVVLNQIILVLNLQTYCGPGNEPSGSIEGGEFLDYLNDNQFFKDCVPWNELARMKLYFIFILVTRESEQRTAVCVSAILFSR